MAVPKDHLRRFHGMDDAKEIWAAIKTRFGGNANSKKMQKAVLKQQFEALLSLRKSLDQSLFKQAKAKPAQDSYSSYTTSLPKQKPTATPGLADEDGYKLAIAYDCIKIKKVLQRTGRRPTMWDGKMHVAFDKRKVECFNCHNTGHFARECKFKGSKEGSRQEAGRGQDFKPVRTEKEALMTIDEGQINWVEQTTDEELNHALMAFTVNNEVSMCSKLCLDSYNALQAKYDELQSEFGNQEAALLIDCGMSSTVKIGLGYGIKSNAEVLGYEEEISRGIFASRETNAGYNDIPLYSRFKQVEYKGVPHPLSGDYTPREQEDIDDSLYDDGEQGTVSDHSVNDDPITLPLMAGIAAFRSTRVVHAMLGKLHQQWTNSNRVNKAKSISLPVLSAGTHLSLGLLDLITGKGQHVYFLGKMGTAVKTSAGCVWRQAIPLSNTNSGPTPDSNVNVSRGPQGRPSCEGLGPKRETNLFSDCADHPTEGYGAIEMPDENQQKASSNEAKSEAQEFRRVKQPQGSVKAKELDRDKGYKQEFSIARILSKIGVAERSISTLIEDAGTMLADSHLPYTFWAEAFNTACYTFNRRLRKLQGMMVITSTSLTEATRKAVFLKEIATKEDSSKAAIFLPISNCC
ncbi:ribonuclease H-like domain-containing protein [Tanacetum coccineum]|uniref:Ribonuclease H-like domain-containing protein n=1 Tax=Tanacetum coccineum TaxID=301880 RepID=A0ABQ5C8A0_9ASTR